jgi:glutamyl-tRNA reductase
LKFRYTDAGDFYRDFQGKDAMLFQTGTRVEIYATVKDLDDASKLLEILKDGEKDLFESYLDRDAAVHLFRLAGGIESRVYGETYIPWQVERALKDAKENSQLSSILESLFNTALVVARRARSETDIEGRIPVEEEAIRTIREEFYNLNRITAVLLGAGLTGRKIARRLRKYGSKILAVNRNFDICVKTAEEIGGTPVDYANLQGALRKADLLICATLASHFRVTQDLIKPSSLVIVDVSPFGNVDPQVTTIPGVVLKNGALRAAISKNMETQKSAIPHVERIIEEEIKSLSKHFSLLQR